MLVRVIIARVVEVVRVIVGVLGAVAVISEVVPIVDSFATVVAPVIAPVVTVVLPFFVIPLISFPRVVLIVFLIIGVSRLFVSAITTIVPGPCIVASRVVAVPVDRSCRLVRGGSSVISGVVRPRSAPGAQAASVMVAATSTATIQGNRFALS